MKKTYLIIALAVLFLVAEALIFYPDYDSPRIIKFLILTQVMFAISIGLYFIGRKLDFQQKHRQIFFILLGLAMAARVIMVVGAEDHFYLSDDVYRYIWDGKVNTNGINPFLYNPTEPELAHLQDDVIFPYINHPWFPTIYPPTAQNIFALVYIIGGDGTWAFKLISALFELLTIAALMVWMRIAGIPKANLLLYLYSPLILVEFYLSAHLDILAMPFLICGLIAVEHKRGGLAGIVLALAIMVKFLGLIFVPFFFKKLPKNQRWIFVLTTVLTVVLLYLPYISGSDGNFLGSLGEYLETWQFNGSAYILFYLIFGMNTARIICGSLIVLFVLWYFFKQEGFYSGQFKSYAVFLIFTPVFFPWYFIWIFPFILRNLSPAFIYLSSATLLSYDVFIMFYSAGYWQEIIWLRLLIYLPFYALLLRTGILSLRKK
ncbi:MAG: DUF2029 domain-containing protein [candidate division Zixibacteria bacterium]|nr:DUF2029 domain-containing protein [candidate division Zixibacteria bacterium]